MAERFGYYDPAWRGREFACPDCAWRGTCEQMFHELYEQLMDYSCPSCEKMLLIVHYPSREEIEAAAAAGNPEALREIERIRASERGG